MNAEEDKNLLPLYRVERVVGFPGRNLVTIPNELCQAQITCKERNYVVWFCYKRTNKTEWM